MTLLHVLNQLPAGARLDSTPDYQAITHTRLRNATSTRAKARIIALALHQREAELSRDGKTISVYGAAKFFPWPAFRVTYP